MSLCIFNGNGQARPGLSRQGSQIFAWKEGIGETRKNSRGGRDVHTYDNVIDYLSAMEWPVRSKIFSDNFFVINNFKLICIERETVNKHVN